jgi:hypothetical protein
VENDRRRIYLVTELVDRRNKGDGTEWCRCAKRDQEWNAAALACIVGGALHLDRAILTVNDIAYLGAKELIEECIAGRVNRPYPVHDEYALHAQLGGHRRGHARVVGLHGSSRDERVGARLFRVGRDKSQLAHLVAAKREANRVVALDNDSRWTLKRALKPGKFLARRWSIREWQGRRQRKSLKHAVQYNCGPAAIGVLADR